MAVTATHPQVYRGSHGTSGFQEQYEALDLLNAREYAAKEKKLVRKIDIRLMPLLFAMIVLNYLDRNALANARVQGIEKSLSLKGTEFNTAISVLFAGYIALQIPSNMIITRVRPSLYLSGCMIIWGVVSGLTATVHNYAGLVAVRFFLGLVEAPYFPGALFLLSSWYTRKELALRTSILYAGSLLSGGFGGLVGAGVQYGLDGVRGLPSWRWLFIIEAAVTVFVAALSLVILPDFPHTTKFLSNEERAIATRRLQDDSGSNDTERGSMMSGMKMAFLDYKVWILALIIITKTSAGAVTQFIPTLVSTLGYNKVASLLLVAPPYVFATLVALAVSHNSDRVGERCVHIVVPILLGMVGYIIAAATVNFAARYLSLFLMLAGVYGSYNVALAWISSTLPRPIEKRAAAIAFVNTVGNFAQIYSPYMYPSTDGPRYLAAMIANACFCLACVAATILLRVFLLRENEKLEAIEV
ncbi:MFS transporter, partial [Pseudomassariella vexata]